MKHHQEKSTIVSIAATVVVIIAFIGVLYVLSRGSSVVGNGVAAGSTLDDLVGKPAPRFLLKDKTGAVYTNESLKGKNTVLFFNEGIMCYPACWNQIAALSRDSRLNSSGTVAFSVVIDQPSEWQDAIGQMPELGSAAILFDTTKTVSRAYNMLTVNSSMHYGSYPGHTFVIIDKQGIVRWVFDDPNMAIDNDKIASELQSLN